MKRVAIQLTIASNLPWPVTLTALTLTPQHGFRLDPSMGLVKPLCPLTLNPSSTASALLFVSTKSGGRSASRGNMLRGSAGQGTGLLLSAVIDCSLSCGRTLTCLPIPSFTHRLLLLPTRPSIPPFNHPSMHALFLYLFVHLFIHSCSLAC